MRRLSSNAPIQDIDVKWNGTAVNITGKNLAAGQSTTSGIAIYAPSATAVTLNGSSIPFTRNGAYIYAVEAVSLQVTDLVETPRANAVASSALSGWEALKVKDDNSNTIWSSTLQSQNGSQWIYVDMGANYNVRKVRLQPRSFTDTDGKLKARCFPVDFKIQYSTDATNWTDVPGMDMKSFQGNFTTALGDFVLNNSEFTFADTVNTRYIRVLGTKFSADENGAYYMQIADILPFSERSEASRYNAFASSSHNTTSVAPDKVIDNNPDNFWSSAAQSQTGSQWIAVGLGGKYTVNKIVLVPRNVSGVNYCFPEDFKLQSSMDGVNWTDIPGQSYSAHANPIVTTGKTFNLSSALTTRFIRVLATKFRTDPNSNYYLQMAEIYAYFIQDDGSMGVRAIGHQQNYGWQGWATDGAAAGTTGQGKRIEAMEVMVYYD